MTLKKIACMILMSALFVLSVTSCAFGNNNTGAKTVESIEYVSGTVSASIKVGESLDTSNLKVKVTYSDGTTEQVSADKLTIGRIDTGVVGTHNLSVTYENKTIYVPVAVEATGSSSKPTVTAISNIRGFKTSLIIGEVFTADGITATVSFSDGTSKTVSASSGLTVFENVDTSKGGTYYVTVSYDGVISSPVSVTVRSAIIGIELDGSSFSTLLYHNDPVDTASIKFFVVYNDGTKEHITDTDALTVDTAAITTANIGDGSFTASYTVGDNTYNCTVPYSVQRKLLSIDVDESTISTEILLGGSVDTSRIVVTVTYSNGESETLSYADVQISNLNTSTIGEKQLTVRYLGYTDTVIVTVNPKLIGIAYAGEVLQF